MRSIAEDKPLAASTLNSAATLTPSNGLVTTVRDLAKFDIALRDGILVESETLAEAWSTPVGSSGAPLPHGIGWFVQYYNGEKVVWQFGEGDNASSSLMITLPDHGTDADRDGEQRPDGSIVFDRGGGRHAVAVCESLFEVVRPVKMGTRSLAIALLLLAPAPAAAEWQIRPFIGFTFGGATTFVDLEQAAGEQKAVIGVSGGWLGEIFGFEGDFGLIPGFFQTAEKDLLLESGLRTLTGNVVVAMPRSEDGIRAAAVFRRRRRIDTCEDSGTVRSSGGQPHFACDEYRRRRHRVPDPTHRTKLGCPALQYPARRR